MRRTLIPGLATGLVLLLLAVSTPTAQADTWRGADAKADVVRTTYSPDPEPCGTDTEVVDPADARHDITRLAVDHGTDTIVIRLAVRELRPRDKGNTYFIHLLVPGVSFDLFVTKYDKRGPYSVDLEKAPTQEELGQHGGECGFVVYTTVVRPCEGLTARADLARDLIEVTLPRACVKDPRWVKVGASTSGDYADLGEDAFALSYDAWGPPGATGFTFGPRVRR